jgi:nitroimidazol reductase NimA-like FMN-containing flavoprotein (pyridoxamine 5'-phosphate oxidase superfamily)
LTAGPPSARTSVRRKAERGAYEREVIHAILDEALICHVGFESDHGPVVLPTMHARVDDTLFLHGAVGNAMLKTLAGGAPVCVTVTLLDGLVLARSAFHHSMNYRSVVVFGTATAVEEAQSKRVALEALIERIHPGRWDEARQPTDAELRSTLVIAVPLTEASAKVRTGPPIDDDEDYALPVWAGVIPLETRRLEGIPDPAG